MAVTDISMKDLLEAGVHFGHKSTSWDPRMTKFIFMKRKGVYIIDLQKTLTAAENAYNYVKNVAANGKSILFVGTKKQAKEAVKEGAQRCGAYYVTNRWIGGLLTNFKTVRKSIDKMNQYALILKNENSRNHYTKKELIKIEKEMLKMEESFSGIKTMEKQPDLLFIIDSFNERNAVAEARLLGIPICGLVDTNANPDVIDVVIPGNDDAIRAVSLFVNYIANAINEGKSIFDKSGIPLDKLSPAEKEATEAIAGTAPAAADEEKPKEVMPVDYDMFTDPDNVRSYK